jgi:hypothetical protein
MKRFLVLAGMVAILAGTLGGCGKSGDPVLADVGSRKITASNFVDALKSMEPENRPDLSVPDGKERFLNDLVNRELMELAAFKKYPTLTEPQTWRLKRYRDGQLTTLVRSRLVREPIVITDAMKDLLYADMHRERHLLGMLLTEEGRAKWAREQLDEGGDWSTITKDNSAHWNLNDPPGDLGWSKPGEFLQEMEHKVWEAPVGATIGPERAAMGWYIFRVLGERPAEPEGTRQEMDKFLEGKLLEPIYMYRQRIVLDSLRTAAGPSYPSEGMSLIMAKYYWEPTSEEAENPFARLDAKRESPEFTPEEEQVIIIDFENRPDWNAKEFKERLEWYPTGMWPTGASEAQTEELYDLMVRDYLWICAAEDLGLDQDPQFLQTMDRREKEMKVTYFYYNDVMTGLTAGPDEIQAWFEKNRERYKAPPSVKLAFFVSKNRSLIEDLAADWKSGMSFMALRDKYEPRDPELETVGESPWAFAGQDPVFDEMIAPLAEGEISEPITRMDVSSVYRVVAKRDTMMLAYDEIKAQVDKDATTALGDEYFQAFLEGQKADFPVKIHEKALKKLVVPEFEDSESEDQPQTPPPADTEG